ncbi:hypothetical protein KLP28_13500 [Nocardioidaceae bacterium]|nr:hypothetical protein KLP28_13500 [Nocardioidaceae bacterium]
MKGTTMQIHIGQGFPVAPVTFFPVWTHSGGRRRFTTSLDQLRIAEMPEAQAPYLLVENPGKRNVFVAEGQLFEGGFQDRMALRSSIIPARSVGEIAVACVEVGRWGGEAREHTMEIRRASEFVRAGWGAGGQAEVWDRISRTDAVGSATTSYAEVRRDIARQWAFDRSMMTLPPWPPLLPGQSGVLIGVGGYPMRLEIFSDPATLREHYTALGESIWVDLHDAPMEVTPGRRARRMVRRIEPLLAEQDDHPDPWSITGADSRYDVGRLKHGGLPVHIRASDRSHPVIRAGG